MNERNSLTLGCPPVKISRRLEIYALVETGGRQYKVSPGQTITVDRLHLEPGSVVELSKVLLLADDGKVTVGRPYVEGAKVMATVAAQGKGEKVIVFEYKAKTRYRRKQGHRQPYTQLTIKDIVMAGAKKGEVTKDGTQKRRRHVAKRPRQPAQDAGGK